VSPFDRFINIIKRLIVYRFIECEPLHGILYHEPRVRMFDLNQRTAHIRKPLTPGPGHGYRERKWCFRLRSIIYADFSEIGCQKNNTQEGLV